MLSDIACRLCLSLRRDEVKVEKINKSTLTYIAGIQSCMYVCTTRLFTHKGESITVPQRSPECLNLFSRVPRQKALYEYVTAQRSAELDNKVKCEV
jgi:hypothetical protein